MYLKIFKNGAGSLWKRYQSFLCYTLNNLLSATKMALLWEKKDLEIEFAGFFQSKKEKKR
jgi:hypothetical protein